MKILTALTYYRPHVSGLTIYVERLARALTARGHLVTVLTSQYDRSLRRQEDIHGVRVVRVPVAARVSKGVLMPTIGFVASQLVLTHDVLSLHLPQLDASGIALRGRILHKPTVLTYHSDLRVPTSPLSSVVDRVVDFSNHAAARLCNVVCAYTEDFALNSKVLSKYLHKIRYILPPVSMPVVEPTAAASWAMMHGLDVGTPVIGVAGRLAADKGIEYLLQALPKLLHKHPGLTVLHAGPVDDVIGEARYRRKLAPMLLEFRDRYIFLGTLNHRDMAHFFCNCDVHVLPSVNSTETFGLVQIEAALCGVPTVATSLPGVRMPSRLTGMGLTVPPRDADALAEGILKVLDNPGQFQKPREPIEAQFAPRSAAVQYENLFRELMAV